MLSTLCLLLSNICAEGEVNVSSIVRKNNNLQNINYIEIEVTAQYKTLARQLKVRNIDFYLKLTVAGKFVVIRYYTISINRKKISAWSGFAEHSIPYEQLMPNYNQHQCCGCYSGCTPVAWVQVQFAYYERVAHEHSYRYTTSHWRGSNGDKGSPSVIAPGTMNGRVEKYVEALRVPLRTYCSSTGGATKVSNHDKVEGWFRQRQGTGKVIRLASIYQVSQYVKKGYPVLNSFLYGGKSNKKTRSGHSAVVTKIKERSRQYKVCRKAGWWWGRRTKCEWKTTYAYQWYRRMGWGEHPENGWWISPSTFGAFVAIV